MRTCRLVGKMLSLMTIFLVLTLSTMSALAQDSLLISYQGLILDAGGDPITGSPAITFKIYNAGGAQQWTETHPAVTVTGGLCDIILGSQEFLPTSIFNGEDRYLGLAIDGSRELTPRTLMTSSPGAAVSWRLAGDIHTGPGMLLIKNPTGDSAVVFGTDGETHAMRMYSPDPGDITPSVEISSSTDAATLTLQGKNAAGKPPLIVMSADAVSAKLGIGADSLPEALTVMGNGWFSGDVFVLTLTKAKRNIVPIDGALEKVGRMNGYYYDCRTDEYPKLRLPGDRQIGFLAEEVNEVVPEAVGENKYGLTGVSYSRITALLVEAVKELKAENDELKKRMIELEKQQGR